MINIFSECDAPYNWYNDGSTTACLHLSATAPGNKLGLELAELSCADVGGYLARIDSAAKQVHAQDEIEGYYDGNGE